jgi:F0F1-type ATP synthase assembly protein I
MSKDPMRDLSGVSGIGFTLVAYVLVFTAIGYGLDRLFKTAPWLMVAGVFVGAVLGFIYMIRTLTGAAGQARTEERRKSHEDPGGEP